MCQWYNQHCGTKYIRMFIKALSEIDCIKWISAQNLHFCCCDSIKRHKRMKTTDSKQHIWLQGLSITVTNRFRKLNEYNHSWLKIKLNVSLSSTQVLAETNICRYSLFRFFDLLSTWFSELESEKYKWVISNVEHKQLLYSVGVSKLWQHWFEAGNPRRYSLLLKLFVIYHLCNVFYNGS